MTKAIADAARGPGVRSVLSRLLAGRPLDAVEAENLFTAFMEGRAAPEETAAALAALKVRGETAAEVEGGVRALRSSMIRVELTTRAPAGRRPRGGKPPDPPEELSRFPDLAGGAVDTCGTGGGALTTFNISTASAVLASAGGVGVAKHGNRSFTSKSGSADVLEALGIPIEVAPEAQAPLYAKRGFIFMFAPAHHPAMRNVAGVRKALGVDTIFNMLGPLANPAMVSRQVVGVADPGKLPLIADVLAGLGHKRALVVHGTPGMDEISPLGPTDVIRVENGVAGADRLDPADLGCPASGSADDLAGGTPQDNAEVIEGVLAGNVGGAARAAVVLNAAAAFWAAGAVDDLQTGATLAERTIDEGGAADKLAQLRG